MKKAKQRSSLKKKKREVDLIPPRYVIYTDGSCNLKSKEQYGGSAYIVIDNIAKVVRSEWSQGYRFCTNNQCELDAIIMAIDSIPPFSSALIITDSKYAITVLSNMKRIYPKNMEFIEQFRFLIQQKHIDCKFEWVRGHSGNLFNEKVDKMAYSAQKEVEQRFKDKQNETA